MSEYPRNEKNNTFTGSAHFKISLSNWGDQQFFWLCHVLIYDGMNWYIIIFKLNGIDIADEDIDRLSYHERCDTLNRNPVLVARHLQYRVEMFFKVIVLDGPLGRLNIMQFE